jgi:hypothetical protein
MCPSAQPSVWREKCAVLCPREQTPIVTSSMLCGVGRPSAAAARPLARDAERVRVASATRVLTERIVSTEHVP